MTNNRLSEIIGQAVASGLKEAMKDSVKEYGKKVIIGIGAELTIHFGSKKIIKMIEERQNKKEEQEVIVEA